MARRVTQIYWDNASLSPVDPRVVQTMAETLADSDLGNPLLSHRWGQRSRDLVEDASGRIRALVGAKDGDRVVFTGSGSESINLALLGFCHRMKRKGNRVLIPETEHMATLNTAKVLAREGFEIVKLPVDAEGFLKLDRLATELAAGALILTLLHGNNEVGTIQPISEIVKMAHENDVAVHLDAIASMVTEEIGFADLDADLISVASNPISGPTGIAALILRQSVRISPIIFGGGQQHGLRSGTENLTGISGFGRAAELWLNEHEADAHKLRQMQKDFMGGIEERFDRVRINGPPPGTDRLPQVINISFSGLEGEPLLLNLDMKGVAASSSSACTAQNIEPSHVLKAMALEEADLHGAILFTPGRMSNPSEVDRVFEVLEEVVPQMSDLRAG